MPPCVPSASSCSLSGSASRFEGAANGRHAARLGFAARTPLAYHPGRKRVPRDFRNSGAIA